MRAVLGISPHMMKICDLEHVAWLWMDSLTKSEASITIRRVMALAALLEKEKSYGTGEKKVLLFFDRRHNCL